MPRPVLDLPAAPFEIGPAEPRWPRELGDLRDPPPVLHVAGDPPPWPRAVAIVGTRRADDDALEFTHRLAGELARAGCTVLSGGARGIDAAAHEGALEQGGCTVAVLATGLQRAYPPQNAGLLAEVARRGALVSETADCEPHRGRFLGRNRLIAALARVVVVVQAPYKSGALSTAAHARRLGRPLLAVPASPWDIRGEGSLALLAQGAGICTRAPDVLSVAAFGTGARPGGEPGTEAEN
ncbi:MAG: DNA-processing protein DprA, partial [Myxococcota bacterium]